MNLESIWIMSIVYLTDNYTVTHIHSYLHIMYTCIEF